MRATRIHAPFDIRLEEVPEPALQQPTDAIVRVVAACGSVLPLDRVAEGYAAMHARRAIKVRLTP